MSQKSWRQKVEDLKLELAKCDAPTQAFIGPLLKIHPVQQLLISFLNDRTK